MTSANGASSTIILAMTRAFACCARRQPLAHRYSSSISTAGPGITVPWGRSAPTFEKTLANWFGSAMQVTEQSSMDLLYPAQLVFHYERLMSLAFALAERPFTALLLGVGGAAMWRFVRAYLPECAPTLVDCDETVVAIAKRWFYLNQPVVLDTAERYLAATTERFDVILVDLYNSGGPAEFDVSFWARCF